MIGNQGKKVEWSGISQDYVVTLEDGTELRVRTAMADAVRWEAIEKRPLLGGDPPGLTGALTLLWIALRRTGQIESSDRKGWMTTVADFGVEQDEDAEDEDEGVRPTE